MCLCDDRDDRKSETPDMSDALEQLTRMRHLGENPKFNGINIVEDARCVVTVTRDQRQDGIGMSDRHCLHPNMVERSPFVNKVNDTSGLVCEQSL